MVHIYWKGKGSRAELQRRPISQEEVKGKEQRKTKAEQPKDKLQTSKGYGVESFSKAGETKSQMQ